VKVVEFRKETSVDSKRRTLDKLFRDFIRERDRTCQAEGLWGVPCAGVLQVAHFHSRRYLSVRWEPSNAALMCLVHHFHADTHQDLKWFWVAARLGSVRFDALGEKRTQLWDRDYQRAASELAALMAAGGGGA
jgi:hypothetical protein